MSLKWMALPNKIVWDSYILCLFIEYSEIPVLSFR